MRLYSAAMRRLALAVTCMFGFMTVAMPVAQAGMISVERYAAPSAQVDQRAHQRTKVQAFLQRDDVRTQLVNLGVDPQLAQARVAALSEAELARASSVIDQPAGGDAITVVAVLFLVLVITDILGYTDVFTFIRK